MQPFRPRTRPSCSWWPGPPQTPEPKSKLSHPSVQLGRVARFAAQTAVGVPCPHLPSHPDSASLQSVPGRDLRASVPPARDHPDGRALHESFHVLPANKRYVLTKFPLVQLNQTTAVSRLFLSHAVEYRSGRGKLLAQSFGKICIDALVFFFQRNGQSENLAFRQLVEVLHGAIGLPMRRLGSKPRDLTPEGAEGLRVRAPNFSRPRI